MLFAGASLVAFAALAACSPAPAPEPAAPAAETAAPEAAATPAPVAITVPAGEYVSDPTHSSVTFKVQHMGLAYYTLGFKTFDATVTFDPANLTASKVTAKIAAADIQPFYKGDYKGTHAQSKFASWEDDLANSTNFLDAKAFPEITFVSTAVEVTGARTGKVTGELTLKGVTKPVVLDVTFAGENPSHPMAKGPAIGFSATGSFKRSDYGLSYLVQQGMVGDDVSFAIEGDFLQKPAG
jgi:polyisoprenoid-binding protein YceI